MAKQVTPRQELVTVLGRIWDDEGETFLEHACLSEMAQDDVIDAAIDQLEDDESIGLSEAAYDLWVSLDDGDRYALGKEAFPYAVYKV